MSRRNWLQFVLVGLVGSWLLLIVAYSVRSEYRIGIGEFGDAPYLNGFNGDEAGTIRYRWTGSTKLKTDEVAIGVVNLPLSLNPNQPNKIRLTFRAARDRYAPFVEMWVNGQKIGEPQADPGEFKTVELTIPKGLTNNDGTLVEIKAPAFKPTGDSRALGVQVSEVRILTTPMLRFPPLTSVLWGWLYTFGIGLVLLKIVGIAEPLLTLWAAGAAAACFIPILLLPLAVPFHLWYMPILLPIASGLALAIGLLTWHAPILVWFEQILADIENKPFLARNSLLVAMLLYSLFALNVILKMDFIGHADYADNAVAARNIVQGKGYSLDYAAQFYYKYSSLPRPADTWPPLQPFLIAPFFAIFGSQTWAAKLPNLFLMLGLIWVIFWYGKRLFNQRTALFAALGCMVVVVPAFSNAPAFFETIAYPINDLAFTLLATLTIFSYTSWLWQAEVLTNVVKNPYSWAYQIARGIVGFWLETKTKNNIKSLILPPIAGGLLFLSKPSGIILLVVIGGWLLWHKWRGYKLSWTTVVFWAGLSLIVISPFLIRNLLEFGSPFRSTEQFDAWVTKWNPPDEHIYDLYAFLDPTKELPQPRQLLLWGWDANFNAVNNQFKKFFSHLLEGQLFAPLMLILAALGVAIGDKKIKALAVLLGIIGAVYLLFFNLYWHYEPRYFLMWLPFLLLSSVYALTWLYDKINTKAKIGLFGLGLGILLIPGILALWNEAPSYTTPTGIVTTAHWLRNNTPSNSIVMSRNVWELSFHSGRKSVMIPNNASLAEIKAVMSYYNVKYIQLDHLADREINRQWGQRQALVPLLDRQNQAGFELIYDKDDLLIYQWNGQ